MKDNQHALKIASQILSKDNNEKAYKKYVNIDFEGNARATDGWVLLTWETKKLAGWYEILPLNKDDDSLYLQQILVYPSSDYPDTSELSEHVGDDQCFYFEGVCETLIPGYIGLSMGKLVDSKYSFMFNGVNFLSAKEHRNAIIKINYVDDDITGYVMPVFYPDVYK